MLDSETFKLVNLGATDCDGIVTKNCSVHPKESFPEYQTAAEKPYCEKLNTWVNHVFGHEESGWWSAR